VDEATHKEHIYTGAKNLTFVGGGSTKDQIKLFSAQQLHDFNYKQGFVFISFLYCIFFTNRKDFCK